MVPARNMLHLPRDAHGRGVGVTAAPLSPVVHMAQEPLDQHREPSKQPPPLPPPQEERQADHRPAESRGGHREEEAEHEQPQPLLPSGAVVLSQEAAGISGSSSGGSSANGGAAAGGGWLSLGLAPSSPGSVPPPGSQLDLFADRAPVRPQQPLPGEGAPPQPLAFRRPAVPGIPQASVTLPAPRAGPPWMMPWSQASAFMAPQPTTMMLPFAHHRTFYTPGAGASAGVDTIRVVFPPPGVAAAAGVWFVLQAAPHQ